MSNNAERWLDLALSVSDGASVDWDAAQRGAQSDEERALVQQLHALANLSTTAESLQSAAQSLDDAQPPVAVARWGPFELCERLAAGSFGEVYRARDPRLDTYVALKLMASSASAETLGQRAIEEGRLLAKVRHPHVVSVYGADSHNGRVGIWMELIEGHTLTEWLAAHGAMGAREAAAIGGDLCAALAAVHAAGLVHRDVKAQNVMRQAGGRVVLMDLGAGIDTKRVHEQAGAAGISGTPLYMAPELFAGHSATAHTDVYALGVLLFHLVTQQFPVAGVSVADVIAKHASGTRRRLRDLRPDLPSSLVAAIDRSIDPDPKRRFATAGEFDAALREDVRVDAPEPSRGLRLGVSLGSLKFSLAIAFAIAVVIILGSFDRQSNSFHLPGELSGVKAIGRTPGVELPKTTGEGGETPGALLFRAGLRRDPSGQTGLHYTSSTPLWMYLLADEGVTGWRVVYASSSPLPASVDGNVALAPLPDAQRWRVVGSRSEWNRDVAGLSGGTAATAGIRVVEASIETQVGDVP